MPPGSLEIQDTETYRNFYGWGYIEMCVRGGDRGGMKARNGSYDWRRAMRRWAKKGRRAGDLILDLHVKLIYLKVHVMEMASVMCNLICALFKSMLHLRFYDIAKFFLSNKLTNSFYFTTLAHFMYYSSLEIIAINTGLKTNSNLYSRLQALSTQPTLGLVTKYQPQTGV